MLICLNICFRNALTMPCLLSLFVSLSFGGVWVVSGLYVLTPRHPSSGQQATTSSAEAARMSRGVPSLQSTSERDAFKSVGVIHQRVPATYEHFPQCAQTLNNDPVLNIFIKCLSPGALCCSENLGGKQIALCEVHGCCLRLMPNPVKGRSDFIGVTEPWGATGALPAKPGKRWGPCTGFSKTNRLCNVSCGASMRSDGSLIDCRSAGITVPTDFVPFTIQNCKASIDVAAASGKAGSKRSKAAIIGGSVGGLLGIVLLTVLTTLLIWRVRSRGRTTADLAHVGDVVPPHSQSGMPGTVKEIFVPSER
jgi:hypothetical protein